LPASGTNSIFMPIHRYFRTKTSLRLIK